MNRHERRRLQRLVKRKGARAIGPGSRTEHGTENTVRLIDGPMGGTLVTPTAPALDPKWGEIHGGRYGEVTLDDEGMRCATWIPARAWRLGRLGGAVPDRGDR